MDVAIQTREEKKQKKRMKMTIPVIDFIALLCQEWSFCKQKKKKDLNSKGTQTKKSKTTRIKDFVKSPWFMATVVAIAYAMLSLFDQYSDFSVVEESYLRQTKSMGKKYI